MEKILTRIGQGLGIIVLVAGSLLWWAQAGSTPDHEQAQIMTYNSPPLSPTAELRQMTIMTYNVGYFSGLTNNKSTQRPQELFETNMRSIATLIQDTRPDIVALQEIDFASKRSYKINQLDALAEATSFPIAARAITWDKHYVPFPPGHPKNYFGRLLSGQALLSKFPILSHERVELQRPSLPWHRNAFYPDRVAQVVQLDRGGETPVIIIHAHLDHEFPAVRHEQLGQVATLYRQYAQTNPVILLGDFNSVPTEEDIIYENDISLAALLEEPHITEAFAGQPKEATLTYRADTPDRKLDHVFYNTNFITLVRATVATPPDHPSDHRALIVQFQLSK